MSVTISKSYALMKAMNEMMRDLMTQMNALPLWVRLWTGWMMAVFFSSAFFCRREEAARVTLGAFLLTMGVAMALFQATGTVKMIAAAHLLVWTPLLGYLAKLRQSRPSHGAGRPLAIWLALLIGTIGISLMFDAREVVLFIGGY